MLELRASFLLVYGTYLFCGAAELLRIYHISIFSAFGAREAGQRVPYKLAHTLLGCLVFGTALVTLQSRLLPGAKSRLVALGTLCSILVIILSQRKLRSILWRTCRGGISSEHRLGDIIVSDSLVSLATVLVDIVYSVSLSAHRVPLDQELDRTTYIGFKILLVACLPQGIRIKQCIIDYKRSGNKQHLLNMLKYIVANVPHACRANMALLATDTPEEAQARESLFKVIYRSLVANAIFSFGWDLIIDWKLGRLLENNQKRMGFPSWSYITAAIIDLVIRFQFMFSTGTEHFIFMAQLFEISRRAMWVLFRTESEPVELTESLEMQ